MSVILENFNIKYHPSIIVSRCPIHKGDNDCAFNLNTDINSEYCGRWFCNTKKCHEKYGGDIIGFIRGMLEHDGITKFNDILLISKKLCGAEKHSIKHDIFSKFFNKNKVSTGISREEARSRLCIPSDYYINRGFSKEVLNEFDVGLCTNPKAQMYNRIVFPVYDNTWKIIVGSVGRSTQTNEPKWKVQNGFKASEYLFNYWRAIEWICRKGKVYLVEGQGEVMRFWEAEIYNTVGIFGSNLSDSQEMLLQKTGVSDIITAFDNDKAGERARATLEKKMSRLFNISHKIPSAKDFGEMSPKEVRNSL